MSKRNQIADLYDRVASSAPISGDAARTYSMRGAGDHGVKRPANREHYEAPPRTLPPPPGKGHLVGKKYGQITVLGYLRSHKTKGSRWLVRCLCGRYEVRSGKSIDKASPHDCCDRCSKLRQLQRNSYKDRHGRWPEEAA